MTISHKKNGNKKKKETLTVEIYITDGT